MTEKPLSERVLELVSPRPPWLSAWRELEAITLGIEDSDPRFPAITAILNECDQAFLSNDWVRFEGLSRRIKNVLKTD